jgi:hypothetical protein
MRHFVCKCFFSQNSSSSPFNTLRLLNYFIDVNCSLAAFQQYSVEFLSGVAGRKIEICNQCSHISQMYTEVELICRIAQNHPLENGLIFNLLPF